MMPKRKETDEPKRVFPTRETVAHGRYAAQRVEKGAPKIAVNKTASPLRVLLQSRSINAKQCEAGEIFEALYRLIYGGGRKDILLMEAVGISHETEAQIDRIRKARDLMAKVGRAIPKPAYLRLIDVCVAQIYMGERRGREDAYRHLHQGLNACIEAFGL